jgi:hypothetical protein
MRWAGNAAFMGEMKNAYIFWTETWEEEIIFEIRSGHNIFV